MDDIWNQLHLHTKTVRNFHKKISINPSKRSKNYFSNCSFWSFFHDTLQISPFFQSQFFIISNLPSSCFTQHVRSIAFTNFPSLVFFVSLDIIFLCLSSDHGRIIWSDRMAPNPVKFRSSPLCYKANFSLNLKECNRAKIPPLQNIL